MPSYCTIFTFRSVFLLLPLMSTLAIAMSLHAPAGLEGSASHHGQLVYRRQAVTSTSSSPSPSQTGSSDSCSALSDTQFYCTPVSGDTWLSGESHEFRWNTRVPAFASRGQVDVHLYRKTGDTQVQNWTNVDNAAGRLAILVPSDDTWFMGSPDAQNNTYSLYFIVVVAGSPATPGTSPQGPVYNVIHTTRQTSYSNSGSGLGLPGVIGIVAAGLLTSLGVALVFIWFQRRVPPKRIRKGKEKLRLTTAESTGTIESSIAGGGDDRSQRWELEELQDKEGRVVKFAEVP